MAYKDDGINEDTLFELYDIVLGYVPDKEREDLAQHVYDWLRGWEAPVSVYDGLIEHDKHLSTLAKDLAVSEEYEEEEETEEDYDSYDSDDE